MMGGVVSVGCFQSGPPLLWKIVTRVVWKEFGTTGLETEHEQAWQVLE